MDFLVKRDDLHQCRTVESPVPDLEPGQALLSVDAFGLTANNVTYAAFGDTLSYWSFFPAEEGWGRIPVWGFADVAVSEHPDLPEGTRVFGYLPMSTHLVARPEGVSEGAFVDATEHRAGLPATYNRYLRVEASPNYDPQREGPHMLLWPLFATAFLIDDFLAEHEFFGAGTVVMASASSKTALGTAFLIAERGGIELFGLTSHKNAAFVGSVGVYNRVVTYDEIAKLPGGKAVYVDMSGDGAVRAAVHRHYGDDLVHDCMVGDTHWDETSEMGSDVPGPQPTFFFAPDRVVKRNRDWGFEEFQARLGASWNRALDWSTGWLEVVRGDGPDAVERAYRELLDGRTGPAVGNVLSLRDVP